MRKCSKPEQYFYLIMNKPCGYVCSAVSDSHKTVYELLTPELRELVQCAPRGQRLHTVGRLDCDTSGLLLITNDGEFSHKVADGSEIGGGSLEKVYRAELDRPVEEGAREMYRVRGAAGVVLPAEKKWGEQLSAPATLNFTAPDVCEITVREGKFHEVRRIFRALGNEVKELERISIGGLELPEDLEPGQWREMTEDEISLLNIK